jgi:hypothetical protein
MEEGSYPSALAGAKIASGALGAAFLSQVPVNCNYGIALVVLSLPITIALLELR